MSLFKVALCLCLLAALASPFTIQRIVRPVDRRKASSSATIRLTYINHLTSWMGYDSVPSALGVPGYALNTPYNYVAHTFWTYPLAPLAATLVWSDLINRMGGTSYPGTYGNTTKDIQTYFKANFSAAGVKLLASAFGSTQTPTSSKFNATDCGLQLAQFVKDNQYDGVDIDWEDTPSFSAGDSSGQNWLITLTQVLRANLPAGSIITHAPQAPYFGATLYPKGAYLTVDQTVGSLIDFYNIQFYNQGKGLYETPQNLFNVSEGWCPGTSVNEIIAAGVPASKVVLGKPATHFNAKSGIMDPALLNQAIVDNYAYNGWNTGIMFWQYSYDLDGAICEQVGKGVITSTQIKQE